MSEEKPKLTDKQQVFVEHYLQCWNATEAARRAGYEGNDVTLASVGYENLRKPHIDEYKRRRISEIAMGADEVLLRLSRMARGSIKPFLELGDHLKGDAPRYDLSTEEAQENLDLIKKLKTKTVTRIKEGDEENGGEGLNVVEIELEIHDPKDALVHLGRHHKLFTDKQEVEHSGQMKLVTAEELDDDTLANIASSSG